MLIFLFPNENIARNVQPQHKHKYLLSIPTNAMHPSSLSFLLKLFSLALFVHTSTILSIYCPLTLHVASLSTLENQTSVKFFSWINVWASFSTLAWRTRTTTTSPRGGLHGVVLLPLRWPQGQGSGQEMVMSPLLIVWLAICRSWSGIIVTYGPYSNRTLLRVGMSIC